MQAIQNRLSPSATQIREAAQKLYLCTKQMCATASVTTLPDIHFILVCHEGLLSRKRPVLNILPRCQWGGWRTGPLTSGGNSGPSFKTRIKVSEFYSSLWRLWMWRPRSWPAVRVCLSLAAGALASSVPLSLSHALSLYVTFSFSLCLFLYQFSPLSANDKVSSTPTPPTPIRGWVCSAEEYLTISGTVGRCGQKMSLLFISKDQLDNIQFVVPSRLNTFLSLKFPYFMLLKTIRFGHIQFLKNLMWNMKLPKYTVSIHFLILSF